jgi:hypothetical protein
LLTSIFRHRAQKHGHYESGWEQGDVLLAYSFEAHVRCHSSVAGPTQDEDHARKYLDDINKPYQSPLSLVCDHTAQSGWHRGSLQLFLALHLKSLSTSAPGSHLNNSSLSLRPLVLIWMRQRLSLRMAAVRQRSLLPSRSQHLVARCLIFCPRAAVVRSMD